MNLPDALCEVHGVPYRLSYRSNGQVERYCLKCQQAREGRFPRDSPRCRRGHLKTPWTWRLRTSSRPDRAPYFYCYTCLMEARKKKTLSREGRGSRRVSGAATRVA